MVAGHSDFEQAYGAYGSELVGLPPGKLLVPLQHGQWPLVRLSREQSSAAPDSTCIGPDQAAIDLGAGDGLLLDRMGGSATFFTPASAEDGRLIHPVLATVGAVFAWWRGQVVFHGGAVVMGGGAWGLLGERGSGKSSLLAGLTLAGCEVLADDVLVVSDDHALAGPRCVDLREETVRLLGLADRTDLVRAGQRRRLQLGPVPSEVPLRGWIALSWGMDLALQPLGPAERLRGLASNLVGLHQSRFLDLGGLPAWRLTRPRGWESFQPAVETLLAHAAA